MIYLFTGDIRSGKTTSIYLACFKRNDIGGFLSPDKGNLRILYDIFNKSHHPFQVDTLNKEETIQIGRFTFLKLAFDTGYDLVLDQLEKDDIKYIIVDEIGKLELKNEGFHKLILMLASKKTNIHLVFVVRSFLLDQVIEKYAFKEYKIIEDINQVL